MCKLLNVSRASYYAYLNRKPSKSMIRNELLNAQIIRHFNQSKRRYGSVKISQLLKQEGWIVSRQKVARMMQSLGLKSIVHRRFRPALKSNQDSNILPNLLIDSST